MRHALVICTLLLTFCHTAKAGIPDVPLPPEVKAGTFADGLSYFVVANKARAGFADFAIVQDGVSEMCIPRQPFLARKGVGYGPSGYTSEAGGSSVIRFCDVPVQDKASLDSTLLMMLDFIRKSDRRQTVIVAGDVNADATVRTLEVLSLTVPALKPVPHRHRKGGSGFSIVSEDIRDNLHRLGVEFTLQAPREDLRKSAVSFVSELLSRHLLSVISGRIESTFKASGVPYSCMESDYKPVSGSAAESKASLSLVTWQTDAHAADSLLRGILSDIASGGTTAEEFAKSRRLIVPSVVRSGLRPGNPNSKYVDQCVAAAVFGLPVTGVGSIRSFFDGSALPENKDLELFRNFASSLMGEATLGYSRIHPLKDSCDTLPVYEPGGRVRLRHDAEEASSGGRLWTFADGIKVVYRKMTDHPGRFSYAFSIRGGLTLIPGLSKGEAPYVSDMPDACLIGNSASGEDFHKLLAQKGITMTEEVTMSDLRISGNAPSEELEDVLQAVAAIAYDRTPDRAAFEYLRQCEAVRTAFFRSPQENLRETMDSIICPDNIYMPKRNAGAISDDLQDKVEAYVLERFSNFADGVIVLAGDMDETVVRSVLEHNLGLFRTCKRHALRYPSNISMRSGRTLCTAKGNPASVNVMLAAARPVTAQGYATLLVAKAYVGYRLNRMMESDGAFITEEAGYRIYPDEQMSLTIKCVPCPEESLPLGVQPSDPFDCARHLRSALEEMEKDGISNAELKLCRNLVKSEAEVEAGKSETVISDVLLRYADGRDFRNGFTAKVDAVKADDVKALLSDLCNSARVEYVFY